jgi:hypothetical protein
VSDVAQFQISGTPQTLLENVLDQADDVQFVMMVFLRKDGSIETEWSTLPNNLQALGAVEVLRASLLAKSF